MIVLPRNKWRRSSAKVNEYHILAFDPGGTTGWAHLVLDYHAFSRPEASALANLISWDCDEIAGTELDKLGKCAALIWGFHFPNEYNSRLDVVSEGFDLKQLIGSQANLLSPVRINAVLDWECRKQGLELHIQDRSARSAQTPARLNAFGFEGRWSPNGKGKDAFAALQHAVTWLRRVKEKSKSQPWKLSDGVGRYWDCACYEGELCDLSHPK